MPFVSEDQLKKAIDDALGQVAIIGEALARRMEAIERASAHQEALERAPASQDDEGTWQPWPAQQQPFPAQYLGTDELVSWVEQWLMPTFHLTSALSNWRDNTAVVCELAACYDAYLAMSTSGDPWHPIQWHGYLDSALTRIRDHRKRASEERTHRI